MPLSGSLLGRDISKSKSFVSEHVVVFILHGLSLALTNVSLRFLFLLKARIGLSGNTVFKYSLSPIISQFFKRARRKPETCGL